MPIATLTYSLEGNDATTDTTLIAVPAQPPTLERFGSWVRDLRIKRGWTQRDLAAFSGMSASTICRIEREHNPALNQAVRLAWAFGFEFGIDLRQIPNPGGG